MLYSVVIAVGSRPPTHLPRAPPRSVSITQWDVNGTDDLNSGMAGGRFIILWFIMCRMSRERN